MEKLLNHSRLRDLVFVFLVFLNLFLISGFLVSGVGGDSGPPGGWRRIDLQALQTRIEAGELVDTEARWYHREHANKAGQGGE
jgi:hypothetical protein